MEYWSELSTKKQMKQQNKQKNNRTETYPQSSVLFSNSQKSCIKFISHYVVRLNGIPMGMLIIFYLIMTLIQFPKKKRMSQA